MVAGSVTIAVIVPALNEPMLGPALQRVHGCTPDEIIVAHAGDAVTLASLHAASSRARIVQAPRGRAVQMNCGAAAASTDVLLFLHADTDLPPGALDAVRRAIADGALWGFFGVRLSGHRPLLRIVERTMNWRSRASGIATGDQAIFVRRDVFRLLGGYAPIELMEDIEFCTRLKWLGRPACIPTPVVTSSRRWEAHGIVRTIGLMGCLRGLYALGVSPRRLARWYG